MAIIIALSLYSKAMFPLTIRSQREDYSHSALIKGILGEKVRDDCFVLGVHLFCEWKP